MMWADAATADSEDSAEDMATPSGLGVDPATRGGEGDEWFGGRAVCADPATAACSFLDLAARYARDSQCDQDDQAVEGEDPLRVDTAQGQHVLDHEEQ